MGRLREPPYPKFFIDIEKKEKITNNFLLLSKNNKAPVQNAADLVCEHRFNLLGIEFGQNGERINWHKDFRTGFSWDRQRLYLDIHHAPYPGGFDIKVPWELSRCQHFVWLGQAYWLTDNEKYVVEFRHQVTDWIDNNPPPFGVNWACTMEVAIRAINWLWGYAFFRQSPLLDDEFLLLFYKSLLSHGRHIMNNLEWFDKLTNNHYLSNLVGLIYLGILVPEFEESHHWRTFGLNEIEKEMFKQVYPDGVCFEASTNYHRLSTELFLSATLLAEMNNHTFSQEYLQRLEQMIEVVRIIAQPDGTIPVIGDQDNGRVHRLKIWDRPEREWVDFRYLLAIGAAWRGNLSWAASTGDNWEEAAWMLPEQAHSIHHQGVNHRRDPDQVSTKLPVGGWYVLKNKKFHILVEIGPNGQNGLGGHAHNDSLSFNFYYSGQSWIQDPGTYTYTLDYNSRNLYRATKLHNTVSIGEVEQNFIDAKKLFLLKPNSVAEVVRWEETEEHSLLAGQIQYLNPPNLLHKRIFFLDNLRNVFIISDQVQGQPGQRQVVFHCPPGVDIFSKVEMTGVLQLENKNHESILIIPYHANKVTISTKPGLISPSYGIQRPCTTVIFQWDGDEPHILAIMNPQNDRKTILETVQKIKAIFHHWDQLTHK